ncbi:hypothetical protein D9V37_10490 [Nocardioides mangrovicus]|uniref:Uncharacterized protein n=1 Tax=Nocardioides mangrovicus TaxID=2478913 RepID=A0A3L8P2D5_9ACTN|nr:hypothetical protein [Nocardioides mangrovicus]RLV49003.1 hypothetical protein D9V37_10490 [Nocardioides mangrovicus]
MSPSRRLDPDRALVIELIATVDRDLHDGIGRDESIELLQQRAGGRRDLLAAAAGHYLGLFLRHGAAAPDAPEYLSRLVAAGADLAQTAAHVRRTAV